MRPVTRPPCVLPVFCLDNATLPITVRGRQACLACEINAVNMRDWKIGRIAALKIIGSPAFTLVEMLVVIGITGILAALLLPALSKTKQKTQGVYCLNNGKEMMLAMTLYAGDYHDFFPPNPDDANTIPGHNWCSGDAGHGQSAEFNPDLLKDPSRSLLSPYLHGNTSVFHCPADTRTGLYQGADPALIGKTVPGQNLFHEPGHRHHLFRGLTQCMGITPGRQSWRSMVRG